MKPHLQTTIWTLFKGGATQREIERITGISRHTIRSYQQHFAADPANSPGVATDTPIQTAPPWPPTLAPVATPVATSKCEREFIGEGANALIIGKPGTGKSHVTKAVTYQATLQGYDVRYVEASSLMKASTIRTVLSSAMKSSRHSGNSVTCCPS